MVYLYHVSMNEANIKDINFGMKPDLLGHECKKFFF